jgi:hypothetical protein
MKNVSVTMLVLLFMFVVTNAEAQRKNKNSKKTSKTAQKKTVQKKAVRKAPVAHRTTRNTKRVVEKPVKRVQVNRTRVVHHHYRHLPKRGALVTTINTRALAIKFGGVGYRFHAGVWYRPLGNKWIVTCPSNGIRVRNLPVGHRRVLVGANVYYYYYGTYYIQQNQEYEVVRAPYNAEIGSLPDGYNVVNVNGVEYYELDNIYYMPSLDQRGEEVLVVVENPIS